MIAVIEPVCHGLEHAPFNSAMIEVIASAYPSRRIVVLAEAQHLEELRSTLAGDFAGQVSWHPVKIPPRRGSFRDRILAELRLLREDMPRLAPDPAWMVMLTTTPGTILATKWLQLIRRVTWPVQAILHGAAADLVGWRSRNPIRRAIDLRSALLTPPRSLQYFVLEESIVRGLSKALPALAPHMVALPHPLPSGEATYSSDSATISRPVKIGFLGLATPAKGFLVFLELARRLHSSHPGLFEFHAIGSMPIGATIQGSDILDTSPGTTKMPRDEYLCRVRDLHYVCLPYQGAHYELTASGALLDAIANVKPLLTFSTPTVSDLFHEQKPGRICHSIDEMARELLSIAERLDRPAYLAEVEAAEKIRQLRQPLHLATTYRTITDRLLTMKTSGS